MVMDVVIMWDTGAFSTGDRLGQVSENDSFFFTFVQKNPEYCVQHGWVFEWVRMQLHYLEI